MKTLTVAQAIAEQLASAGARHAFLVPGGACGYLVDAVAAHPGLTAVPMLHEAGAGIAAESYGQYDGHLGVAVVTSGPGSTNILTAVAAGYTDSSPMIVVAGQVKVADLIGTPPGRQFGFQHVRMEGIVGPITKAFVSIQNPASAADDVAAAIELATHGRPGPVWVEVPLDVQAQPVAAAGEAVRPSVAAPVESLDQSGSELSDFVERVSAALAGAERPALLIGNGVRTAGAVVAAREMVHLSGIPALVTWKMLDFLPESDPLLAGRPGGLAPWHANIIQQDCDVLLVLGTRLDHAQVGYRLDNLAPNAAVYRVECDAEEAGKWISPRVTTFLGDARAVIDALVAAPPRPDGDDGWSAWVDEIGMLREACPTPRRGLEDGDGLSMYEVTDGLSECLPQDAIVISGSSGQGIEVFLQAFRTQAHQRVYCSAALGSMGFGLAASIGAHYASGGRPVWCVEGDGSAAMSLHDLTAIGVRRLPIRVIILDNGGYMSIRMSQQRLVDTRCGFDADSGLPLPDYELLAPALGFEVIPVATLAELTSAVATCEAKEGPTLIHVRLRHSEVSYPRVTTRTQADGSLVTSPLDDMWPALSDMHELPSGMRSDA